MAKPLPSRSAAALIGHESLDEDDLLSAETAAAMADRSVRTIRRAYTSGVLLAYRDGSGRGVRIRYGDLREWMLYRPVEPTKPISTFDPVVPRSPPRQRKPNSSASDNLALLNAARRRRRRQRRDSVSAAEPPAEGRQDPSRA